MIIVAFIGYKKYVKNVTHEVWFRQKIPPPKFNTADPRGSEDLRDRAINQARRANQNRSKSRWSCHRWVLHGAEHWRILLFSSSRAQQEHSDHMRVISWFGLKSELNWNWKLSMLKAIHCRPYWNLCGIEETIVNAVEKWKLVYRLDEDWR